jgi:Fic family protein
VESVLGTRILITKEALFSLGMTQPEEKLTYAITFACRVFEEFLRIHPYANGNGHIARFLIWVILGYCGYWPNNWRIEPRPNPPYNDLIVEYRNGNCEPLEKLILSSLR